MHRYPPLSPRLPRMLHGADYNPEQWNEETWREDMRLMKLAGCNVASVGIFSWARLEPAEGEFDFSWLDRIMDMMADSGIYAVLATPSASRPHWMADAFPEVLRVRPDGIRNRYGNRHNHCQTSPFYREKTRLINTRLAEHYCDHPALLLWHVSNEYSGECHCELCQEAFRDWLRKRYGSLERLNACWWTAFWSHIYSDWSQIEPPGERGEQSINGLTLDWKRFVTDQTVDFMLNEMEPLRRITPEVPVTTNMMELFPGLNYWKIAPHLDVISWDSYPHWHQGDDIALAARTAFIHDVKRSMKGGKPFMLMESTPSMASGMAYSKLKRPGMHLLSSLQAVAHGSDTVQYFQWRKGRGGCEKFHGAVVDHCGHEHTRVFRDVTEVGQALSRLSSLVGTTVRPEVTLIYDWENIWAMNEAPGPLKRGDKGCQEECLRHYRAFWERGIPVDVIDMEQDLSGYKLVVAPMLYMVRSGVAERLERFVESGGIFVTGYWSGIVDENDLCFTDGFPGPLRRLLGIWSEEIDALTEEDANHILLLEKNELALTGGYCAHGLCDLIHAETAEILAVYRDDFYAGRPALTVNRFGQGRAYYIASRNEESFTSDFYGALAREIKPLRSLNIDLPTGVSAQLRGDGEERFVFLMNFNPVPEEVDLGPVPRTDLLTGLQFSGRVKLDGYGTMVLTEEPNTAQGEKRS